MRVSAKLWAALGLLVVILVSLLVYHVGTIRESVTTHYELSEISSRLFLSSSEQLALLNDLEENAGKYWITRETGYLGRFEETLDDFEASLRGLRDRNLADAERVAVRHLDESWREFTPLAASFLAYREPGVTMPDDPLPTLGEHIEQLRWDVRGISEASEAVMGTRLSQSAATAARVERVSWGVALGAVLLSILVSFLTVRSISRQLRRLKEGTRVVAAGDFEHRLPTNRRDEFAELARDFNVMTRRLGELDRMKRDFLSKVSHDLKTPLASIQETTNVLLDGVTGPLTEGQRRLLTLSQQSGQRLSSMIADILDLSGMEAGAFSLEVHRQELGKLVRSAVEQLEPLMRDGALEIDVQLPGSSLVTECDGDRVVQVVANLLENAVKFSPRGGRITITARHVEHGSADVPEEWWNAVEASEGNALLSVADEGPGVPAGDREAIFDRFYQTEVGRRAGAGGVGLGLAICREIVAAHGGQIWVEENPGGGSVFQILLPRTGLEPDPGPRQMTAVAHTS